jgi:chromosome segregation ATPase
MHLSSITIKGFKSFPDRTRLVFAPGVSVIVGPNGCGKSNITDAVLWALGEQSPLSVRGQSMQDMIFAGGDGQAQRRYAEVEVVLENSEEQTEFSEISIKRRLDRNGEGEYRLNGARCRLVDVIETLADANLGREMHSVISQGRVEEIVHSKPRERRLLVEEAAGLGKHRKRRRRAQLKLEHTQDNLDRALDVEREARSRLRPLKRQAQAAEIHSRLERESDELRARLLAEELRGHAERLADAEGEAVRARAERDRVEAELAEVSRRRTQIEERLAARDRDRTLLWGRLTALRAAHERLAARADALGARRGELATEVERRRAALGSLADGAARSDPDDDRPIESGLDGIGAALAAAGAALERVRSGAGDQQRLRELATIRDAAEQAAGAARRIERLLGERSQGSLESSLEITERVLGDLANLCEAAASVRDAAGARAEALEERVIGASESDDVATALRSCSREEAEKQAAFRATGDAVTAAEVSASQLRDRRDEVATELSAVGERLGRELEPPEAPLTESEREEIARKLERVAGRREQLGPVNPLAEREYADALAHVESLEAQREDLEAALAELRGLIAETDRMIHEAFEQTFEATERNFYELVEHLFPGGRGRLRLVSDRGPRPVLGGISVAEQEDEDPAAPGVEDEEAAGSEFDGQGVEIEVTPAGKATRRLSLLSGGEKALVALAFVFSVFLARPSPFYILDEVEAALDDANIDRFLQLVRRFSDRAQFVIVTHQKRTMDAADVLYGVSMGEGGVTKVISRRLPQSDDEVAEPAEAAEAA